MKIEHDEQKCQYSREILKNENMLFDEKCPIIKHAVEWDVVYNEIYFVSKNLMRHC